MSIKSNIQSEETEQQSGDINQNERKYSHEDYACFFGPSELLTDPRKPSNNQSSSDKDHASSSQNNRDFIWSLTDEPHFSRRREILKKYPQIQKLFGPEPRTKWIVCGIVALQLCTAFVFRSSDSWKSVWFWIAAYLIGGTCNQSLFLAIHELSHNLGFKSIRANKLFSILVANVPIAFPYAASFKPYHMLHHKYQGVDGVDTDMPTQLEAKLLDSFGGKVFFVLFQIFFYALRPMFVNFQPLTWYHPLNIVYIAVMDALMYQFMGAGAVAYLLVSTLLAGSGIHPCAAHFLAEHYVVTDSWETYSYYGILNFFCFNVGYHNEHHDFPNIPWSRLPQLRAIASEYYDSLPYHKSWPLLTWKFVFDKRISLWNRVKRNKKECRMSCDSKTTETVLLNQGLKEE